MIRFLIVVLFFIFNASLVKGSLPADTVKKERRKFVFQFDGRNTFKEQKRIIIRGLFFGVKKGRLLYSLGFYGWGNQIYNDTNDSTTTRIRRGLYFSSLGLTYFLLETKKFEIGLPFEIGYGFTQNKTWTYVNGDEAPITQRAFIVPAQIGLNLEWKVTRYFGLTAAIGGRKLLFKERLAANNEVLNFDGIYYSYGLRLYLNNIYSGLKDWRSDLKNVDAPRLRHHKFALYGGVGHSNIRDEIISSFNYQGIAIPFLFNYTHNGNLRHTVSYYFNSSLGSTKISKGFAYRSGSKDIYVTVGGLKRNEIKSFFYNVSYDISARIVQKNLELYTGAVLNYTVIDKYFPFLERLNREKSKALSLGFMSALYFKLSKRDYAAITLSTPLINYLERSIYSSRVRLTNYRKIGSFDQALGLHSKVSYGYKISPRISLEAAYLFNYYQFEYPQKEQYANKNLLFGLSYNL